MAAKDRGLRDLAGVGPRIEADFRSLGICSVEALSMADPDELFAKLCVETGTRQDPCVLDTFRCAVAQARDAQLPVEQRSWWWWSRQRKQGKLSQGDL